MKRILGGMVTSTGSVTGKVVAVTRKAVAEPAEATVKMRLPKRRHVRLDEDASRSAVLQRGKFHIF